MKALISCSYNMDNSCMELKYVNGSMIAIDTDAIESEFADICICGWNSII